MFPVIHLRKSASKINILDINTALRSPVHSLEKKKKSLNTLSSISKAIKSQLFWGEYRKIRDLITMYRMSEVPM